ncbi:unnamed protein product, partial [Vitis vinifera]
MELSKFCYSSLVFLISGIVLPAVVVAVGINYGQIANNLPSPDDVVPLVRSIGASRVKLYDADPKVLRAFANTGVEFIVGLGNEYLSKMRDPDKALAWGVHAVLVNLGLDKQVSVTTAHSLAILETSYPPSAGAFRQDLIECITPILNFNVKTGSPFLINAYPFFAYKANPKQVPIDFIDAVYSALASLGFKKIPVQISETGWPSKGDEDETGATIENAKKYNGNLIKLMSQKRGTPMRPNSDLNIYVFALFNENMKPGPTSERNYGLFKPDGTPAYPLGFSGIEVSSNTTTPGYGGNVSVTQPATSSTGYLSISSATERLGSRGILSCVCLSWIALALRS